jgi:hypothetical protein
MRFVSVWSIIFHPWCCTSYSFVDRNFVPPSKLISASTAPLIWLLGDFACLFVDFESGRVFVHPQGHEKKLCPSYVPLRLFSCLCLKKNKNIVVLINVDVD